MNSTVLDISNVTKRFAKDTGFFSLGQPFDVLTDINLTVNAGDVVGIVGESGSGKSTLVKIVLGLMKASEGHVTLCGRDLTDAPTSYIASKVQPVFQDPFAALNPRHRINDIISLPLRVHQRLNGREIDRRVREMMDLVGLPSRCFDAYPRQLSGGQRQRVAIARALIGKPGIVICDEPTSALDVSIQAQILNLLADLRDELGLTYVIVSHNLAVIEHIATHVAVMYLGRIVEFAPKAEIFADPKHPYTKALLKSVLTPEVGLGVPDVGIGSSFPSVINRPSGCSFHTRCPEVFAPCSSAVPTERTCGVTKVACHLYSNVTAQKFG